MKVNFARGMATENSQTDLCLRCKHSLVVSGHSATEVRRRCNFNYQRPLELPFRVAECSEFYPSTLPWMSEMKDVAWLLASDSQTKKVGFLRPGEWNKDFPPGR